MISESVYRTAFLVLLVALLVMRFYFMVKVRRSGGRIMPDEGAVQREGGRGVLIFRMLMFLTLIVFLGMYLAGVIWLEEFSFPLPGWLRWAGFALGAISVIFWTWTQVHLDTQWSAQLQLKSGHQLVATGPYAYIRHPLYTAMIGWSLAVSILTANWIFLLLSVLAVAGILWRVPKEEQMMVAAFGDQYAAYRLRTGKFFPKI